MLDSDPSVAHILPPPSWATELLEALTRLDLLLGRAIDAFQAQQMAPGNGRFRGLLIDHAEVSRLLQRKPGEPYFYANGSLPPAARTHSRLHQLQSCFRLSEREIDVLLIALAPHLDRRYERLYAYLQDDVSARWPTVDLILHLLCADALERLEARSRFTCTSPLLSQRLLQLATAGAPSDGALLQQRVFLDPLVVDFLLGQPLSDERLRHVSILRTPEAAFAPLVLSPQRLEDLEQRVRTRWEQEESGLFYVQGGGEGSGLHVADGIAAKLARPVRYIQGAVLAAGSDPVEGLARCLLAVRLERSLAFIENLEQLPPTCAPLLTACPQPLLASGGELSTAWQVAVPQLIQLPLAPLTLSQRAAYWAQVLTPTGVSLARAEIEQLAARFRLAPRQIATAVAHTCAQTAVEAITRDHLFAAARHQTAGRLAALTQKVNLVYSWEDIVLSPDALEQLQELCNQVRYQQVVWEQWRFKEKMALGRGINALFAGPSGTGKTMAAGIISRDLGLDLFKINLAGVVSKYIGETEKNLDQIFEAAQDANAILFFDEADALFGKRSEVSDAHDRYANIEISYLLQKMEEHDGLTILATNLRQNLDDAFKRRMAFTVHFQLPDAAQRQQIWESVWPEAAPRDAQLDFKPLAEQFKLSGGNIRNIALASAYSAIGAASPVTQAHLLHNIGREYQKLGEKMPRFNYEVEKEKAEKGGLAT